MKRILGKTAAVILTRGNLFCLSRRTNTDLLQGFWQFVGGREDSPEESHRDIAVREIREEIGLDVEPDRLSMLGINYWENDENGCALFHLELSSNEHPQWLEKDKCSEWTWFPIEAVRNMKLIEGTKNFVEEVNLKLSH